MRFIFALSLAVCSAGTLSAQAPQAPFVFRDTTEETGLLPGVAGIRGHGAGWGDVDGDGWPDLYVATFHNDGSKANQLFRNVKGKFRLDDQPAVSISTRGTGVVFADLDNDGDQDLYVGSMPGPAGSKLAERTGHALAGCSLFRNEGSGKFTDVSKQSNACPESFGGRSVTVLDYDGDGLLDLLVGEDPLKGYNGSPTASSRLFHNEGDLQFADRSRDVGLPESIPGLGVAAADLNNDGWPDVFLASSGEAGNRLLLNDGRGKFREPPGARETFAWPTARGDNMVCGVALGDVNGDGLFDVVLGQHFERPWLEPVSNRLYLNRGIKDGMPQFEDVSAAAGLVPLPMKAPHVEIQDFDNDGRVDIYTSIVKFAGDTPHPMIFRNLGTREGLPRFEAPALSVNDFPTAADKQATRTGPFFEKLLADKKITYTAAGPSADYDFDGRLDLFLASWWMESPSMLLRNETPGGKWLDVRIRGDGFINRMGIGSRVYVYEVGKAGNKAALLASREIAVGFGYASGQDAIAHFGLGERDSVDVEIILPHGKGRVVNENVKANQPIDLRAESK